MHPTISHPPSPWLHPFPSDTLEVITEGRREVRALLEPHFLICRMSSEEYQKRSSEARSGGLKKKRCFSFLQTYFILGVRLCIYISGSLVEKVKICECT